MLNLVKNSFATCSGRLSCGQGLAACPRGRSVIADDVLTPHECDARVGVDRLAPGLGRPTAANCDCVGVGEGDFSPAPRVVARAVLGAAVSGPSRLGGIGQIVDPHAHYSITTGGTLHTTADAAVGNSTGCVHGRQSDEHQPCGHECR